MDKNSQQQWHSSIKEQIIIPLLKLQPPDLPSKIKLQAISSVQLALWAISTLIDDDPTGVIEGSASTDPTTMVDLITALQSTASTAYSRTHILHYLSSKQDKLSANFEHMVLRFDQKAPSYEEEFPSLSSSPRPDHGPMNAVEASFSSSKRPYHSSPLELVGSSKAKRQTSVSVSAATVATQVGVSSSVFAKPRNPGQRAIIPAKHFGEYHGSDKILQLATEIPPGALAISSKNLHHRSPRRLTTFRTQHLFLLRLPIILICM
jgi:hypothetical protein